MCKERGKTSKMEAANKTKIGRERETRDKDTESSAKARLILISDFGLEVPHYEAKSFVVNQLDKKHQLQQPGAFTEIVRGKWGPPHVYVCVYVCVCLYQYVLHT